MKNSYDVIIIGASIAGLECAKNLADSNLSVLVIERQKEIHKPCGEGILPEDLEYIPKHLVNSDFQKLIISYRGKEVDVPSKGGIVASIERKKLINYNLESLSNKKNIEVIKGVAVSEIISNKSLKLSSGETLSFKFLVGADGSASMVRKYLNIPVKKMGICIQYLIPEKSKKFNDFVMYLDDKKFGSGYVWIFPNNGYASVGCGSDIASIKTSDLRENFEEWLRENNINVVDAKFESASISYDYRGYKFGNIFLAGDAAGLVPGPTGKGITAAFLSGKQVAMEILGVKHQNLIEEWVKRKKEEDRTMFFFRNRILRPFFFLIFISFISNEKIKNMVARIVVGNYSKFKQ